jgi:hypothetical protein
MAMIFFSFLFLLLFVRKLSVSIAQTPSIRQKKPKKSRKKKIEQKRLGQTGYCIDGETDQTVHGCQVKRRMFRRGLHDDESWMMIRGMAYNQG